MTQVSRIRPRKSPPRPPVLSTTSITPTPPSTSPTPLAGRSNRIPSFPRRPPVLYPRGHPLYQRGESKGSFAKRVCTRLARSLGRGGSGGLGRVGSGGGAGGAHACYAMAHTLGASSTAPSSPITTFQMTMRTV